MTHDLKILQPYFDAVMSGDKTFEIRRNDREYSVGDSLLLREWSERDGFSGRQITADVTFLLNGGQFGIACGHCVMAIRV